MTNVIAWPPFDLTGWELADVYPQSRSVGLIQGRARTSSAQRARRVATANVTGIGRQQDGAGYVRMLNRQWAGRPNLVRMQARSSLWWLAGAKYDLRNNVLNWTAGGTDLVWSAGGDELIWGDGAYALTGAPVADAGWNGLTVSGLPPSRTVARPSELISVSYGGVTESARVLKTARADGSGVAVIRTDRPTAFTLTGLVSIGHREEIVFEALSVPRAVQGVTGTFGYQWDFREVFVDEYPDGWTDIDPWS